MPDDAGTLFFSFRADPSFVIRAPVMLRHLNKTEEYLAVGCLGALGILLFVQVVLRFVFDLGYGWIEEIARILFVWVIFLGAIIGMQLKMHIRVTAGFMLLPKQLRPYAALLGDLLLLAFCIAAAWHGAQLVASTIKFEFRLQSTGLSMAWPYGIMPISFGLQAIRLIAGWRTRSTEASSDD